MYNLENVPLSALSSDTKHLIATLINPPKVVPTKSGLLRDWRGLAQCCNIRGEAIPAISTDVNPFECVLSFIRQAGKKFTLKQLRDCFVEIERWDILDDADNSFTRDAKRYVNHEIEARAQMQKDQLARENEIFTITDTYYDALVLYADTDLHFIDEMIEKLEVEGQQKLCLKDRDMLGGITFEHIAFMRLISDRCKRLIAVITPEFLLSPANRFLINYAQAQGIDHGESDRKIIPCIYKQCKLPLELTYYSKIYYENRVKFFWPKLLASMKYVPEAAPVKASAPTIREIVNAADVKSPEAIEQINTEPKKSEAEPVVETTRAAKSTIWTKWRSNLGRRKSPPTSTTTSLSLQLPSVRDLDSLSSIASSESIVSVTRESWYGRADELDDEPSSTEETVSSSSVSSVSSPPARKWSTKSIKNRLNALRLSRASLRSSRASSCSTPQLPSVCGLEPLESTVEVGEEGEEEEEGARGEEKSKKKKEKKKKRYLMSMVGELLAAS